MARQVSALKPPCSHSQIQLPSIHSVPPSTTARVGMGLAGERRWGRGCRGARRGKWYGAGEGWGGGAWAVSRGAILTDGAAAFGRASLRRAARTLRRAARRRLALPMAIRSHGPRPTAHGPRPTAHGPRPTAHGPRPTAHGPRPTAHGPRPTAHGPRPTAHGPRPTAHAPRPTAHGPYRRDALTVCGRASVCAVPVYTHTTWAPWSMRPWWV